MSIKRIINLGLFLGALLLAFGCGGGSSSSSSGGGGGGGGGGGTVVTSTQRAVSSGDVDILVSVASSGKKHKSSGKKGRRLKEILDPTSFSDKKCLIFIAKLSDPSYSNLVGIIKTDDKGTYEIKTEDIFAYLKTHIEEVGETADFADLDATVDTNRNRILAAFKKLGVLRMRAFYNDDGKVVSMEFFQNVVNSDPNLLENADPRNRIVAHWVEKIFKDLGIIPTEDQYKALEAEIKGLTDEILNNFELPEGVTLEQFSNAFKNENSVILTDEQKTLILAILASATATLTQEEKDQLAAAAGVPLETAEDSISNEINTSLTGLINSLGDQIQEYIKEVLDDPTKNPAFAKLLLQGGTFLDTSSDTFKEDFGFDDKAKESLIRFFIAMGFPVVVQEGDATTEPLIAIALPMPGNVSEVNLPGGKFFGDRNIRVFKVSDISAMVTTANSLFTSQDEVDALAIKPIDTLSEADFSRLERLRVLHGFIRHLKRSPPMVSTQLIEKLLAFNDSVTINEVAAIMTEYFVWRQESISLVDDGKGNTIPVFTGGLVPPSTGEDIDATEIVRKLGILLGADPIAAVDSLTSSDGFLFQFIDQAIQEAVNRSNMEKKVFSFPKTLVEARTLIRGSNAFKGARDSVGRGLIAAFPPLTDENNLYGKLLDGETSLNAKSAIFFVTYLFHSKFQIDSTLSYFDETLSRPRLDNDKFFTSKDSDNFSLVKFVSSLLSISEFSDSSYFTDAENLVKGLGQDGGLDQELYYLPEFRENFIPDQLSKKANIVATANFEFFDGRTVADISSLVSGSAVPVKFGPNGPEIGDGAAIDGVITAVTGNSKQWTIKFSNVPSDSQYLVALTVTGYTHDVPHLFFFADGFADPLDITKDHPFIIPPDEETFVVPSLGMQANQKTFGAVSELMGIDFSNFEEGKPFLLPISKDGKDGFVDLRFALLTSGQYSLETTFPNLNTGATDSKALIAPLYINWTGTEPVLGIKPATDFERLANPQKALGLNFITLVSSLASGDLTEKAILTDKSISNVKTFLKDGPPLFLLKDRKGIFWVIGVKNIDNAIDPGFVDLSFVRIGPDGKIQVPDIHNQKVDLNNPNPSIFITLHYGDHAYFPDNTAGGYDIGHWEWSAPEEVPFGFNSTVAASAQLRYAGEDFQNHVGTGSAPEITALNAYIKAGDFTDVPSRLDYYGPVGGGLAVVQFDSTTFAWPSVSGLTFTSSVSGLVTGDLVLIRFKDTGDADLIALVDKKTGNPAQDNFKIGLVVGNFADDKVQVAGVLVDADIDGFIAKFDPNDNDSNIKPNLLDPNADSKNSSSLAGPSQVTGIFASENGAKFIFVEMQENMDEVYQISVAISIKHANGSTETFPAIAETNIFEVTPADFTAGGNVSPTGVLKFGTAVTLKGVSFNNLKFDLITSASMFNAGGTFAPDSRVIFDYEFKFRPHNPATGKPISDVALFGSNPARPSLKGSSELIIPPLAKQVGDFDKSSVFIQLGTDTPQTMADNVRLEPQKQTLITWGAVANADFYEISLSFENFSDGVVFLPYFRQDFMAPSNNRSVMIPSFMLPQGRSGGSLQIIARRYNALGQPTFDGTVVSYSGLSTTGDATTAGVPNGGANDISLKTGDILYFHSDTRKIDTNSTGGQALFSITPKGTTADLILNGAISAEGILGAPVVKKSKQMKKYLTTSFPAGSTINVTPGSFLRLLGITLPDSSEQPIDINFSGLRVDSVVIQAFLPPPFVDISTGGNFDVNGDLTTDVVYDGTATLTFSTGIIVNRKDVNLGSVVISTAGVPTIYSLPLGTVHQDFDLELSDGKKFWFFIDLGAKTVQWGEIVGGGTVGGDLFNGTLVSGKNIDFDSVNFGFAVTSALTAKTMIQFIGSNITSANGWVLSTFDGNGNKVDVPSITPAVNSPKVYRASNASPSNNFDLELTLFGTGELSVKIMPPSNSGGTPPPPPPADPFTTNTFVFNSLVTNGQFLNVPPVAPFTFTVNGVSSANTALSFSGSILTPGSGWIMYNELNAVLPSLTPTVGFANFIRLENTTVGVAFSGFVKLENADARIGVLNVNAIGGGTGGGTFTGLFLGTVVVNNNLTVNDNGTTATFLVDATNSNVLPLTTILTFSVTNEVVPLNGWFIEIFNGTSFVAAGPVFATAAKISTRFRHPSDLRSFNIDFKLNVLDLNAGVISMERGTPPPPPPGILIDNGQYFNHIPGAPTTFAMSTTLDTNPLVSESIAFWNSGAVTGSNTWQIFDLGNTLLASITPTVGGTQVFFKNSNPAVLEAYKVKLTLSTPKVAFEVIQIIPITPPPAGTDVADTMFFDYKPGNPATFVTSGVSVIGVLEESIFQFSGGQILQANSWGAFDATGVTPVVLPFTPTVAVTTLVFKKAGTKIKVDVNLAAPNLHVVVVNVMLPPPMVDVLDTNFFKYVHGAPATFVSSPTTAISATEETIFQFNNSTSQIIQDNGWNAFDASGVTPVPLPFTATVAITTLVFKKGATEIKVDVKLVAPKLQVAILNVIP